MISNNRIYTIGSVTLMLVLVVAGWFLGAQPFIDAAAAADAQRASVDQQNSLHQSQIAQLTGENAKLADLKKQYTTLAASIPASADTAPYITGLDSLATAAGVQITGLTVGSPRAYSVPASAAGASQAPAASTSTPTPSPTATAAPVSSVPKAPSAVTDPLITPANFVGIEVGINVAGSYDSVLNFVNGLQSGSRLFLVTTFSSSRNADAGDANTVTAHVGGYIYVLKQAE